MGSFHFLHDVRSRGQLCSLERVSRADLFSGRHSYHVRFLDAGIELETFEHENDIFAK